MARMYVGGIVGADKTSAIAETIKMADHAGIKVNTISLGEIYAEFGEKLGTKRYRLNELPLTTQKALGIGVMEGCAIQLKSYKPEDHVIIEGPLSIIDKTGLMLETFNLDHFNRLYDANVQRGFDRRFVSIIEEPRKVQQYLANTTYPRDLTNIINWSAIEADKAKHFSNHYFPKQKNKGELIVPRASAPQFLLKILLDENAPVVYFAYSISAKNMQDPAKRVELEGRIDKFLGRLNNCAAYVKPMELPKLFPRTIPNENGGVLTISPEISDIEISYTKHRDIDWFVPQADMIIGYFPEPAESKGVPYEFITGEYLAKSRVLIHPEISRHPFNIPHDLKFQTEDQFFEAVTESRTNPNFKDLQMFLADGSNEFRFSHLFK